jgi:hypothetical protein
MQLGSPYTCLDGTDSCPDDEALHYTMPPNAQTSMGPVDVHDRTRYFPYSTIERLNGLHGISPPRWGLVLFAGVIMFAATLGIQHWRR